MNRLNTYLCSSLILLSGALNGYASDELRELVLLDKSKLWLEGDSSLHAYESLATELNVSSTVLSAPLGGELSTVPLLKSFSLQIPVTGLVSSTKGLSSAMHKALKHKENPQIVFIMIDYELTQVEDEVNDYIVEGRGLLEVAGTVNEVEIRMDAAVHDKSVQVTGEKVLLMSSYGIKPPTFFFGRMKTADEITISWDLTFGLQPKSKTSPLSNEKHSGKTVVQ